MSTGAIVGRVLKDLRVKASMTQQQLADALGSPQSFVSKYEIGERRLDVLEVRAVCVALGTTLQSFVELLERELDHAG